MPTAITNSGADQDAILFRDQALKVAHEFETMQYSIRTLASSNPSIDYDHGNGTSMLNAIHETTYKANGEINAESIAVGKTFCIRATSTWSCYPDGPYSVISNIINILEGKAPYRPFYREVTASGTKMDTYNGTECRTFYVESTYTQNGSTNTTIDEVCFDLKNHYPLRILSKSKFLQGEVITYEASYETFNLEFNGSIDEIILPQQ